MKKRSLISCGVGLLLLLAVFFIPRYIPFVYTYSVDGNQHAAGGWQVIHETTFLIPEDDTTAQLLWEMLRHHTYNIESILFSAITTGTLLVIQLLMKPVKRESRLFMPLVIGLLCLSALLLFQYMQEVSSLQQQMERLTERVKVIEN